MNAAKFMNHDDPIAKALRHVGSYGCHEEAGRFQFEMLQREGLKTSSRVLEIGCGCLNAGHWIIDFLEPVIPGCPRYVGLEPTAWLVEAGRDFFNVRKPFEHSTAEDFDARDGTFDVVYSHSVLSHTSRAQLADYFTACRRQLAPGGLALASLRLCETWGGHPETDESYDYPAIRWFRRDTVLRLAKEAGLRALIRPDLREAFMAATRGDHHHDWIEMQV